MGQLGHGELLLESKDGETERIRGRIYASRDEAKADVFDYVERF
jgi:hypothetical protein